MNLLMISSELAPLAKTGGLADAVAGLSSALGRHGHDVTVLLPRYAHLDAPTIASRSLGNGMRLLTIAADGRAYRICLLDAPALFAEPPIYTGDARDAARFLALCDAAVRLPEAFAWPVDIYHCHDWHAALVPALLRPRRTPTLLTLHNIGYQGDFAAEAVDAARWPELDAILDDGRLNFLRTGIAHADLITTVSPTYAREILHEPYAMGLQDILTSRRDDLVGILNGVDYGTWSPECDPFIAQRYDARDTSPKRAIKAALVADVGLAADPGRPLIGVVTRLAEQKGIDLLTAALPALLAETDASFVVLGSGEAGLAAMLSASARQTPARVAFVEGYDEALAHRILAGSDFVLVPSRYEPCGLTQLYALRYGSIPIVRKTGGLADTVAHFDPANGTGNGSVFEDADPGGLIWGTETALAWYRDEAQWARLLANAMRADHSWDRQASEYQAVYARLCAPAATRA